MKIRLFEEADRPFLRTLFLAARRHNWTWLEGDDWQLEDFDAVILGETVLVAEIDGHRAGFAGVLDNDNFLHSLYIDPDYQGQGVGSALLEAVQQRFTSTGALKCLMQNEQALAFYAHHGWQREATGEGEQGKYVLMHFPLTARASGK
ncbi:GNAT family N-acetyltransferase [Pantoea wallisii]|uniref:GNAT family N-acetyltransferase n=1 Tax=Pantoea wallisii TaxID=1076551 RepID=A0A1X1CWI6_9GAMM|nr:GNAT family N-acetyltransferase [Pantoea wallisii]ORM68691.1 GNAT family N-acetyltransferase [Pantoea wallisii]